MKPAACLLLLILSAQFAGALTAHAQCPVTGQIAINHRDVATSCGRLMPGVTCLNVGQIYAKDGESWRQGSTSISGMPTAVVSSKPSGDEPVVEMDAYEFMFVSDTRGYGHRHAVVGIVASRFFETGAYPHVHLFRNGAIDTVGVPVPPYLGAVETDVYQRKIVEYDTTGKIQAIEDWLEVPDYPDRLEALNSYLYGATDSKLQFWKTSLKIRQEAGGVACIPFTLAVDGYVDQITVRAFLQHEDVRRAPRLFKLPQ
ncbi:MAG: hypothetical protein AB7I79_21790 [Rhizobiaceae bacterium]